MRSNVLRSMALTDGEDVEACAAASAGGRPCAVGTSGQ